MICSEKILRRNALNGPNGNCDIPILATELVRCSAEWVEATSGRRQFVNKADGDEDTINKYVHAYLSDYYYHIFRISIGRKKNSSTGNETPGHMTCM